MNGLIRGLQLIADWFRMQYRATVKGNADCVTALSAVAAKWHEEATGVGIMAKDAKVKGNILFLLLVNDPFKGSRQMFEDVKAKFPGV